jgi:hypothetical protein
MQNAKDGARVSLRGALLLLRCPGHDCHDAMAGLALEHLAHGEN